MAKYPELYNELLKQHEESKALEQQEALARQSVAEGTKGAGIANTLLNTPTKYQILAKSAPQDNYKQLLNAYTGGAQAGVDNSEMMRKGGQERWKNTAETYKMMTDADYKNKMLGILKQKADAGTKKPSVGETAVDRAYAAEYAKDVLEGGSSDRASKLANLGEVINSFDTTAGLTGGPTSYLPNIARYVLNPKGLDTQQKVEEAVVSSLRATLGPQFTEAEGKRIINLTYDPKLAPEVNLARVKKLKQKLDLAAQSKEEAKQYYEQHGTLSGYTGKIHTAKDFEPETTSTMQTTQTTQPSGMPTLDEIQAEKQRRSQSSGLK